MKKPLFILCAIVLLLLTPLALAQQAIPLIDLPRYHQWPETDIFSYEYAAIDGSDETYHFALQPTGQLVLEYASPSHPSSHHQYPLDDYVYIRDDGFILLDFVEDYASGMKVNGVLIFGGKEYWPTWLTASEQTSRSQCGDVLGNVVPAAAIDGGYYRIGNGHYGYNNHLYFVPDSGSPILLAEDNAPSGFCVYDGWFYLTAGKTDAAGNYVAYQNNALFSWSEVYLIGMNSRHLYFCDAIDCMVFETDHNGGNARCIFDLGSNGIEITFTSMNEDTICCTYSRHLNAVESEASFALIDLNTYQYEFLKPEPYRTSADWSYTCSTYADWAGIFGDCVLFYNSTQENMIRKLDLNTRQISDFLTATELPIRDGFYVTAPRCALVGEWLYHPYYGDATILMRSNLNAINRIEYEASLSAPIENIVFANNRLLLCIEGDYMTNYYTEIGY